MAGQGLQAATTRMAAVAGVHGVCKARGSVLPEDRLHGLAAASSALKLEFCDTCFYRRRPAALLAQLPDLWAERCRDMQAQVCTALTSSSTSTELTAFKPARLEAEDPEQPRQAWQGPEPAEM